MEKTALVNPIKEPEGWRCGRAFVRGLSLRGLMPGVGPNRDSLFVKG
jgi:hypothetical protein